MIENQQQPHTPYQATDGPMQWSAPHAQATEPEKRKRKWILPAGLAVAGLVLGFGAGVGAKPEPVIEVQEKIVEKEVTVEVTPPECIEALDLAAVLVEDLAKVPAIAADGMGAALDQDVAGINAVTERLKTAKAGLDLQKEPLGAAVSVCRASAE